MAIYQNSFTSLFIFLCFVVLAVVVSATPEEETTQNLIDWIFENGGDYNLKQGREEDENGNHKGIFAIEDIGEGEYLLMVPWTIILGSAQATQEVIEAEQWKRKVDPDLLEGDFFPPSSCRLISAVYEEALKHNSNDAGQSTFAPYLRYLSLTKDSDLQILPETPSVWSQEGRDLLEDMNDHGALPPINILSVMNHNFFGACVKDIQNNVLETKVASTVAAHSQMGDYGILVPLLDNHYYTQVRNSDETFPDTFNTKVKIYQGHSVVLYADAPISKGEEIIRPYDNYLDDSIENAFMFMISGIVDTVHYPKLYAFEFESGDSIEEFMVEVLKSDDGEFYATVDVADDDFDDFDGLGAVQFLAKEFNRLQRLKSVVLGGALSFENIETTIPPMEWEAAWKYYDNLVQAIGLALTNFDDGDKYMSCSNGNFVHAEGSCPVWDGFSAIPNDRETSSEEIDLDFNELNPYGPTENAYDLCNDELIDDFDGYVPPGELEVIQSQYQQIRFFHDPDVPDYNDMVMKLDGTVQQITTYRPHYHEFAVHFPARFLESVERVLFVGGGDSMVLHEVLKYPSLQKVVGLELDQYVVRNSFRYFNTQPHFDDKRVEWWFGDGAKSLLMLPKDYFQSFDLVVVDLSETVMSFQVTNKLSIFQTLALLLKPDGILLKNGEYYMEKMSTYFDYTLQYFEYDVPFVCDQGMVIGSNKIDFFNHTLKDHGVELLVLEPQEEINEKFDEFYRFTEYRKNNAIKQGYCNDMDYEDEGDVQNAGILMVVEIEGVSLDLTISSYAEFVVTGALTSLGYSVVSSAHHESSKTFTIMAKEGYVTIRLHPSASYVSVDIQLWANFDLLERTRDILVQSLEGTNEKTSSFRIVTGGMSGSPNFDRSKIGPRMINSRNCEAEQSPPPAMDVDLRESGLKGTLEMADDDIIAAVICGFEDESCKSLDILKQSSKIGQILPIYTCESMRANDAIFSSQLAQKMAECEVQVSKSMTSNYKISLLVIDDSAKQFMGKVLLSIFTSVWNRRRLFSKHRFVALAHDMSSDGPWRRNLLLKIREIIVWQPMSFVDLLLQHKKEDSKISLLSLHDTHFFLHLKQTVDTYNQAHNGTAIMAVDKVFGGLVPPQIGHFHPKTFMGDAYDPKPAKSQQRTQKALGRQSVLQFEIQQSTVEISLPVLKTALTMSSIGQGGDELEFTTFEGKTSGIGDGLIVIACSENTHIALSWDGKTHIGANLYSEDIDPAYFKRFISTFEGALKENTIDVKLTLSDTHPRGVGKVVSFPGHMN